MKKLNEKLKTEPELLKLLVSSKTYQEFLNLYFQEAKALSKAFSYGQFAIKSGISKSLIKAILDGKKRITHRTLTPILQTLDLPLHVDNYFSYLVALEDPSVLNPLLNKTKIKTYLQKFSILALQEHGTFQPVDDLFKQMDLPFIYASLGDPEKGANLETIIRRTGLSNEKVMSGLEFLIFNKTVTKINDSYIAERLFSFLDLSKENSFFHHFYLHLLEKHFSASKNNFVSKKNLFHMNVFSAKSENSESLKQELKEILNNFVQKNEDPDGDIVLSLQTGLF